MSLESSNESLRDLVIRPRAGWVSIDWRELWESRELLYFLVLRDIKVRYKQTVLGVVWAVLQPVFSMAIFAVIFGRFAKIPSDGIPYPIFVFAGLLPWTFFSNNVNQASMSLLNQQSLLTKIYLPRLFIPAASIGSGLIDLLISFGVLAVLMVYFGTGISWGLFAVPLLVVLAAAASLGVGLLLAALIVSYRDFRYVVPFLIQSWLYISPVIYPVSMVPERWQPVLALNPMAGIIDGFRSAILGLPWNTTTLGVSTLSSLLLLWLGMAYFRRTERGFADIA